MSKRPSPTGYTVIGLIGTQKDLGGRDRWSTWRPTISLCQHEDLLVKRLDLLCEKRFHKLKEQVTKDVQLVSPETEVVAHEIDFGGDPWDFERVFDTLYAFAEGYEFSEDEDYLVHITTGTHVAQICLFLLTESRHFPAALIQTGPPLRKHRVGTYQRIDLDLSRYDRIASRFAVEREQGVSLLKSGIETRNAPFNALIEELETVAVASKAPILITGPTGAGKSQLAKRVYELRHHRRLVDGPFVEVNCATLRGDAAGSTLFGHKKGAFTGAVQDREGLLRSADGGLLFLDEIGELGEDEQAMLLRALEEKRFLPLGSDREVKSDFQLIGGTNKDLGREVAAGRFREDLLARINLWTFRLPSLAERMEDLAPNLDYELAEYARRTGTRVTFNKEARERYLGFAMSPRGKWRANFRDLNASVTRMATLASGGRITRGGVDREIERLEGLWAGVVEERGDDGVLEEVLGRERVEELDRFERVQLAEVVRVCRESRSLSEAGRVLFAASRARKRSVNDADRVRKYLAKYGLEGGKV